MHFFKTEIRGNLLPAMTLCLTFDDGPGLTQTPMPAPGPRTDDLAFYLFLLGIPATFFVIGDYAASEPELCRQLSNMGHLLVNHTKTHNGLLGDLTISDATVIDDVVNATGSIGTAANPNSLLLRPPYGGWSEDVARVLNGDSDARKFTGPVLYDIGANDWQFWDSSDLADPANLAQQVENAFQNYYAAITTARSGIVDLHDSSEPFRPILVAKNQTYALVQRLIPQLIVDGYRFVRLDAVPQVRSAMQVSSILGLKTTSGNYVSPQQGGGGSIFADGGGLYAWEELGLVQLATGKQAFRTPSGHFMSTQPSGDVLANAEGMYDWEMFELLDQGNGTVAIQTWNNNYVSAPSTGQITVATTIGPDERFIIDYLA